MWIKNHGSQYSRQGTPDLTGCVEGYFVGLEVKVPGKENTLTELQEWTIQKINDEGGLASMVTSVDDAVFYVGQFLRAKKDRLV